MTGIGITKTTQKTKITTTNLSLLYFQNVES